jgi:hypothetical protein
MRHFELAGGAEPSRTKPPSECAAAKNCRSVGRAMQNSEDQIVMTGIKKSDERPVNVLYFAVSLL